MLKVNAGKYKRSNLITLTGEDITRPTRDQLKQALFSSINITSEDYFLDLFSGSGQIGIEALSLGCQHVYFNDANPKAYKVIQSNLAKFKENRPVYNLDYRDCLNKLKGNKFDYIFIDPPYNFKQYDIIFDYIVKNDLLASAGIILIEVRKDTLLNETYNDVYLYKEKIFGISKLEYYKEHV